MSGLDFADYEFRVRAKNKAGLSEHSNPLKVTIKPEFSKLHAYVRLNSDSANIQLSAIHVARVNAVGIYVRASGS